MEIKPQDLRVGNLVIANGLHEGKIMTVEGIGRQGTMSPESRVILFKEHHVGEFIKDIKGIELTPEWLERFGFEYEKQTNGGYERWEIKTTKGRRIKLLDKKFTWGVGEYSDYILHVHQLQNLYFALTGEELAIDKTSLKN